MAASRQQNNAAALRQQDAAEERLRAAALRKGIGVNVRTGVVSGAIVEPERLHGAVRIWSPELEQYVTALNVEAPQVTQERAGNWQTVERPGLVPLTTRSNPQLLKIRLVLLLDGWQPPKRSVQPDINALRLMGYRGDNRQERTVRVIGAVPYSRGGLIDGRADRLTAWVIDGLSIVEDLHFWGNGTQAGAPCRATATLDLIEYQPGDSTLRTAAKRTIYKWKSNDMLSAVAKSKGVSVQAIRDANPGIKRFSALKAGRTIAIPPKAK